MHSLPRRRLPWAVFLILFGSLVGTVVAQAPSAKRLRVYVFTRVAPPGEPASLDQAQRLESVKNLQSEVRKHSKAWLVAATNDAADLTLEVQRCETRDSGESLTMFPQFGGNLMTAAPYTVELRKNVVLVRLSVVGRDDESQLAGDGASWMAAASETWKLVERSIARTEHAQPGKSESRSASSSTSPGR